MTEDVTYAQQRALRRLASEGWLLVFYLEPMIGPELTSNALEPGSGDLSEKSVFSEAELQKLRLLVRIVGSIQAVDSQATARRWLIGNNPLIGENVPIEVLATQQTTWIPPMSWSDTEDLLVGAAEQFVRSSES
jgi:hypothetical protein